MASEDPRLLGLRTSLAERCRALRPAGDEPPAELLDLELRPVAMPGGQLIVVKPRDWPKLREATSARGEDPPYWAIVWPSGLTLARHLAGRRDLLGRRVLELGCGLGVAAAVAARKGADVLATDADPDAVAFAAHTLALNETGGNVAQATWADLADTFAEHPFDYVVAADVLYRRDNAEALARVLPLLVHPDGEVIIADPGRGGASELWPMLRRTWRRRSEHPPEGGQVQLHHLRPGG